MAEMGSAEVRIAALKGLVEQLTAKNKELEQRLKRRRKETRRTQNKLNRALETIGRLSRDMQELQRRTQTRFVREPEELPELTDLQRDILQYIIWHRNQMGMSPTIRELANRFGQISTNAMHEHIERIDKKGYITRTPHKARSIQVLAHTSSEEPPADVKHT